MVVNESEVLGALTSASVAMSKKRHFSGSLVVINLAVDKEFVTED